MRSLATLTYTEFKLTLREPMATFFTLIFPLMILVMFGSIFGNEASLDLDGWGAMDVSVQGYVAMVVGTVTMLSIPIVVSSYRQYRIFRRMRATPLQPATIIAAHGLVNLVMTALGLTLLLAGGRVLYGLRMPENATGVILSALVSYGAFAAIGFLIGGTAPTSRTAQVIGNVIYFPQLFLAGAMLPREMFPDSLRTWTSWLPMTQMVEAIHDPWTTGSVDWTALAALTAMGAVAAAFSSRMFRWEG